MWKKIREKTNADKVNEYLNALLENEDIVRKICCVEGDCEIEPVNDAVGKYSPFEYSASTKQAGRVWILVGRKKGESTALTVGQSLDIFSEIKNIVYKMFNKTEKDFNSERSYYKMKENYDVLTFYEVEVNEYLEMTFGKLCECSGIVKVMFDMSKEYMAEAALAYHTYAPYWGFCNSGMDKRALFHLWDMDNESCEK